MLVSMMVVAVRIVIVMMMHADDNAGCGDFHVNIQNTRAGRAGTSELIG